jgi:hypothetical protein
MSLRLTQLTFCLRQSSASLIHRMYAVPVYGHSQWYLSFFLYFVFSLCERKNEIQMKSKVPERTQAIGRLEARPRNSYQ